jgi:hypothetical protein
VVVKLGAGTAVTCARAALATIASTNTVSTATETPCELRVRRHRRRCHDENVRVSGGKAFATRCADPSPNVHGPMNVI